jgi:hypothetical protein
MTMMFRTIKDNVVSILGDAAAGQYRVAGYQEQRLAAEELEGNLRLVQVRYKHGAFPRSASGRGPFAHNVNLQIVLTVSHAAGTDLSVLDNPAATPAQIAAALGASIPAEKEADDAMDELFDLVFNTLMAGDNLDLGAQYQVANRWIEEFEKSDVINRGEYAVVGGMTSLSFRVEEQVPTTEKFDLDFVSTDVDIQGEDAIKAGVTKEF